MFAEKKCAIPDISAKRTGIVRGDLLTAAARAIADGNAPQARVLLRDYAATDLECPLTYNLLGLSYESEGDRLNAVKFYRIAYYMDQSCRAAANNLDRVGAFWYKGFSNVSWGIEVCGGKKI